MPHKTIQYAKPELRFLTYFIDGLIYGLILSPIVGLFVGELDQEEIQLLVSEKGVLALLDMKQVLFIQLLTALSTMGFWFFIKSSPSKYFLNIRVVDAKTLKQLTLLQCFLRYVGLTICFLTFGIGFLWMFLDPKRQGLHDKIANSVVINETGESNSLESKAKETDHFQA